MKTSNKNRKYRLLTLSLHSLLLSLPLLSCGGERVVQHFELAVPLDNFGNPQSSKFVEDFNSVYEKLRATFPNSEEQKTVFIKKDVPQGGNTTKWNELASKKNTLFFFSSGFYFSQTKSLPPSQRPKILLQTLTHAFKFDPLPSYYQDGSLTTDYLLTSAKQQNTAFHLLPFKEWGEASHSWNGTRYNDFYTNQLVDFYRGNLWIRGSEETRRRIKEAWRAKDWASFRSFGFILGEPRHTARWRLPEALLKKHFNLPQNTFTDLLSEQVKYPQLFRNDKAWFMASKLNQNYHIAFDDEASFAYTLSTKENQSYYSAPLGEKLEVFAVTDPLLYDVAVVDRGVHPLRRKLIALTFLELAKQGLDSFGPSVGFNGYRLVEDEESEFFARMAKTLVVE